MELPLRDCGRQVVALLSEGFARRKCRGRRAGAGRNQASTGDVARAAGRLGLEPIGRLR